MKKLMIIFAVSVTSVFLAGCNSTTTSNYEITETSGEGDAFEVEVPQEVEIEHEDKNVSYISIFVNVNGLSDVESDDIDTSMLGSYRSLDQGFNKVDYVWI